MSFKPDPNRYFSLEYLGTEEIHVTERSDLRVNRRDEHRFGFVLQENVTVTLYSKNKCKTSKVLSGEFFLIPPECDYAIHNEAERAAPLLIIRFHCLPFQHSSSQNRPHIRTQPLLLIEEFQLYSFRMPQVRSWIQDFMSDCGKGEPALVYQLQSHLYAMAAAFMTLVQKPKELEEGLKGYVEQTRQYMLEQYHRDMDIEELARLSGSSSSRFYQAFRRHTGLSPNKFITKVRLDASLRLLANTREPIIDVAHSIGYADEYYFSRLFKKHMGMAPTEFAACAQKKVASLSPVFHGDLSVLGITSQVALKRGWSESPDKAIMQLKRCQPELILTSPISEELHQTLSEIAPVVMLYWKRMSWKERLLEISMHLGVTSVAERWLSYFDMKVENARFHIRNHLGDEPVLLVRAYEEQFRVFGMKRRKMKDLFYDDLQVTPPDLTRHIDTMDATSLTEIAALDCDNVLFLVDKLESEAYCTQLEYRWGQLRKGRNKKHCLFIRHGDPLLYNAAVHESLVDQTVHHFMQYRS
ncbi:helix-turn-helix domain-containing protein [Paenibacillus sp. LMG 31456]|uniref:Helix-turn-helix domain-containing protein n=1 Tax=Paenibacillus foliorum TaxID=2654974 RepID=A0A972K0V8_9BACL|nr:AraC family transcriptional regulator [Paenibacillus foliorum]NOU92107.1 helix-turn-helix domain-containing protein [Paenibacillus foliorum]